MYCRTMTRLRTVVLATTTTVLGVRCFPIRERVLDRRGDTIMFGTSLGIVLTMIGVPVLYCCLLCIPTPRA